MWQMLSILFRCWEWSRNKRLSRFQIDSLGRKTGKITNIKFINETDKSLLMVGSGESHSSCLIYLHLLNIQPMVA